MSRITLLGESIHGVAEFTRYKHAWLVERGFADMVIVFEADHVGMLRSLFTQESPLGILANFPKVHRTREMLALLEEIVERRVPFFGVDVVCCNKSGHFDPSLMEARERQQLAELEIYGKPEPFPLRDEYMCDRLAEVCLGCPERPVVGLFHNMHIKKSGSSEAPAFRLPSVAECLLRRHHLPSHSIGLFVKAGRALHNDLTEFAFSIEDDDAIETLAGPPGGEATIIAEKELMGARVAYHHGFEKETRPVAAQYDECVVFPEATPPHLVTWESAVGR